VEVSSNGTSRPAASSSTTLEENEESEPVAVKNELVQLGEDGKRDGKLLLALLYSSSPPSFLVATASASFLSPVLASTFTGVPELAALVPRSEEA